MADTCAMRHAYCKCSPRHCRWRPRQFADLARVATMPALAYEIQQMIDCGAVQDWVEVARRLGLTRSRSRSCST